MSRRAVNRDPVFIDVFAGCGGLSLGLLRAGWRGLFAVEKDAFAFDTLQSNLLGPNARYGYNWASWLEQKPWAIEELISAHYERLSKLRGQVDLLAGGPPCQGFSSAGRRRHKDPRNRLVERYLEFVDLVQPRIVLIENVKGITYDFAASSSSTSRRNFANELIARLEENYHVYKDTVPCSAYGVPQRRPRFFLVGILKNDLDLPNRGDPFAHLQSAKDDFLSARRLRAKVSCQQAISDLEVARAGTWECPDSKGYDAVRTTKPRTNFQRLMRDGYDGPISDTRLAKHRPHIVKRFAKIIDECKKSDRLDVQINREMRERYGIKKMATRVLDPAKVSPTITSMPDDLLHYSEPRTLTVRENARLQTFPDWFSFHGKYTTGGDRRAREVPRFTQVANAVPPLLAEMWGEVLLKYLRPQRRAKAQRAIARREAA
ncbi:DNA cytosine methyltransferase [Pelagibius sp. CAU 1746]|uniref:DNA cytosine methyltransferase n=1 Tax=Pelagibius sp. CAU 1746 TaxID=3140370 RepID=UPI00325B1729